MTDQEHRNDIYEDDDNKDDAAPLIPAATVVLLRDAETEPEVLLLHRTSKVHFGGMWVFPGGRIDPGDRADDIAGPMSIRPDHGRDGRAAGERRGQDLPGGPRLEPQR